MSEEYGLKFVVNGEDYDKIKKSLNEQIEDLQQKVEQLEKEKDDLDDYNRYLHNENKQLENIRKEAIEWVLNHKEELHHSFDEPDWDYLLYGNATDLLNILNKGSNKE